MAKTFSNKTHCLRGHEFTPDNTYWRKAKYRECITCKKLHRENENKRYLTDPVYRQRRRESVRRWQLKNPDACRAYELARRSISRRASSLGDVVVGERFRSMLTKNTLYSTVSAAVPDSMDVYARDDIISAMIVAVLEGDLREEDIAKNADRYRKDHYRAFSQYGLEGGKAESLDRPVHDGSNQTLSDTIQSGYEAWL